MPHFPLSSRIGFISEREAEILTEHFSKPGKTAMPHELAGKTSITYAEAMSLLFLLDEKNLITLKLLIYHDCQEPPVDATDFHIGLPEIPYICPMCEQEINEMVELSFDVLAKALDQIIFECCSDA